jgi:hypothetical protein
VGILAVILLSLAAFGAHWHQRFTPQEESPAAVQWIQTGAQLGKLQAKTNELEAEVDALRGTVLLLQVKISELEAVQLEALPAKISEPEAQLEALPAKISEPEAAQLEALPAKISEPEAQLEAFKAPKEDELPPRHVRWQGTGAGAAQQECGPTNVCQPGLWCDDSQCVEMCQDTPLRAGARVSRTGGLCDYSSCEIDWLFTEGAPEPTGDCVVDQDCQSLVPYAVLHEWCARGTIKGLLPLLESITDSERNIQVRSAFTALQ